MNSIIMTYIYIYITTIYKSFLFFAPFRNCTHAEIDWHYSSPCAIFNDGEKKIIIEDEKFLFHLCASIACPLCAINAIKRWIRWGILFLFFFVYLIGPAVQWANKKKWIDWLNSNWLKRKEWFFFLSTFWNLSISIV